MLEKIINNYYISKVIGEGGMGNVYLGVHIMNQAKVAIKALHSFHSRSVEIRERFKQEAITLSHLDHPSIVKLYEFYEENDDAFLFMEYVEGIPLDEYIENHQVPLPEAIALDFFVQILDAVCYAHEQYIIHRDIKPSNFIITPDNQVKTLDFGIAKFIDVSEKHLTKSGSKVGTVLYMSPELVKGQSATKATDIYSLGITLFQMLTGQCPYSDELSEYEIYQLIVNEPFPDPRSVNPKLSDKIVEIIYRATNKNQEERYRSCKEFLTTIKNYQRSLGIKITNKDRRTNKNILQNSNLSLPLLITLIGFTLITGVLIAFLGPKHNHSFVLSNVLIVHSKPDPNSAAKCTQYFGDRLDVIDNQTILTNSGQWVEVKNDHKIRGFAEVNFIADILDVSKASVIFGKLNKLGEINIWCKKALINYFNKMNYFQYDPVRSAWMVKGSSEYNSTDYILADFDKNGFQDFACLLYNSVENKHRILVFMFFTKENYELIYEKDLQETVNLFPVFSGEKGGKWLLNKISEKQKNFESLPDAIYNYLQKDAIGIKVNRSNQKSLLYYNNDSINFLYIEQNIADK